jgi:hypothetical protein
MWCGDCRRPGRARARAGADLESPGISVPDSVTEIVIFGDATSEGS